MIKGVHQLTLRPNTPISLFDQFTIFNGWMDCVMDERADPCAGPGFFCRGGVQARRSEYRIAHGTNAYTQHTHVQTGT